MRAFIVTLVVTSAVAVAGPVAAGRPTPPPADSIADARLFVKWAREAAADGSIEGRQRAVRDLRRSIDLNPVSADAWLLLGQVHETGGFGHLARQCFREAIDLAPKEPDGWAELSRSWKKMWLRTLDPAALDSAVMAADTVSALRPRAAVSWLSLTPLLYENGARTRAADAADRACRGSPRRPENGLGAAYTAFRSGEIERADSLFAAVIPRLHPSVARLFQQPDWVGTGGPEPGAHGGAAASWAGLDPDPTTRANELQLEYWSRVAHAFLLFYDPLVPELDARAETYVRYGPPSLVEMNPLGAPKVIQHRHHRPPRDVVASSFPVDAQVWSYPHLGMSIVLQDRTLTGRFFPAIQRDFDPASLPSPRVLASQKDWVAFDGGVFAFPTLPPREQRLDVLAAVARFEGEHGPRLIAHVQAAGGPSDRLWGRWVVFDSAGREIARDARALPASACDPLEHRSGEFSCELPPGTFEVCLSATDARHRRGLVRTTVSVPPRPSGLALSDIVVSCADPARQIGATQVRIEANVEAVAPASRPLPVYFEIYRLASGPEGLARFEYEYAVRRESVASPSNSRPRDAEPVLLTSTSGEEQQAGAQRRQFLSVPTQALPSGHYRLDIRVHDLVAGTTAGGSVAFTRP